MCWRKENKVLSFRQHYFCTFVTYNKIQMDINQNYREAVKSIKEAILRSQYRAAASVNKEQLSLYYGIGRYVSENPLSPGNSFCNREDICSIAPFPQKPVREFSDT